MIVWQPKCLGIYILFLGVLVSAQDVSIIPEPVDVSVSSKTGELSI